MINRNKLISTLMLGALLASPLVGSATSFAAITPGKVTRVSHSNIQKQRTKKASNPRSTKNLGKKKRSRKHSRARTVKSSKKRSKRPVISPVDQSSMGA